LAQIEFARQYTHRFLDSIPESEWFRMPPEGVTHVAWQVGHIAMAQYRLCLERLRGSRPEDEELISTTFLKFLGRDSVPNPDPAAYPPASEIRRVFDAVHAQVMRELPTFPESDLDSAPLKPHPLCKTKGECLRWMSHHEMLHAGQIALLRRLFGQKPIW